MSWITVRADEFCESVRDGTHDTPKEVETGYKLVTAKHIRDGQVYPDEAYNISEKDYLKINERSKVEQWDVLMSMIGNGLGRSAVVKDTPSYAIKNLALFKLGDEVKAKWLHYFLSSEIGQGMIYNSLQGSGQPFISLNLLRAFPIPMPPYEVMKNIVDVASKYDDLIENNQKQIKLLEEAAQRLYKEWFVDLRFPGHETTLITGGIPEGWHMVKLSDVADVNGESISKHYPYDYVDYVDLGSVSKGHIEAVTRFPVQEAPGRAKRIVSDGDVIWGMVRPNLKSYALVFHPSETSVFSTGFTVLHAKTVPFSYLYCHVTQDDFVGYLINCTNGAAYPAVKPVHFEEATILVPTAELLMRFNLITEPMYRKIEALEKLIQQAKEARDRLLPKLMNGEIEV